MELALPNRHALAALCDASEKRTIMASQDIVDERGFKLWARDQRVTPTLQQRLLERKLKTPIESCLVAADGVTIFELHAQAQRFLGSDSPFALGLRPWADEVCKAIQHLPLHSVAQLMLTTVQALRPHVFEHAVQSMVLSGAMAMHQGQERYHVRLALLGGLLHDLGEMYVNPEYLDQHSELNSHRYRHVIVHPSFGALLLRRSTDYPPTLATAIAEHHERADGSGYPKALHSSQISELGQHLGAVETICALAQQTPNRHFWSQASLSMRVIPGEYGAAALHFVSDLARKESTDSSAPGEPDCDAAERIHALQQIDAHLNRVMDQADGLRLKTVSPGVKAVAGRVIQRLASLRTAWNSAGLWAPEHLQNTAPVELDHLHRELEFRCRAAYRDSVWQEHALSDRDYLQLEPLWRCLQAGAADTEPPVTDTDWSTAELSARADGI